MRIMKILLIVLLNIIIIPLFSQPFSPIEDLDVLAMQEDVLKSEYPHVFEELEILDSYMINEHHSKITYKMDGIYHEAIMNHKRKDLLLVAIAAELAADQVPDVVLNALRNSKYGNQDMVKSFKVSTPFMEYFYAFDVAEKDTTRRVYFNELGVIQSKPY